LAISKERKNEVVAQYSAWIEQSKGVILAEYKGLSMKEIDELRAKVREAGGEFHIVKNTLGKLAFKQQGLPLPESYFEGSTAVSFAFEDAPSMAKAIAEYARSSDSLKVKGGYLGKMPISAAEVTSLAEMPPLPVMRARLMGTLLAPASQLARVLSEPGRRVASVLKAYSEKEAMPGAA
jgi:large subunit ribosomal protein L10